jgi:(1->4)-alpha-D-glucan 1-alpha-D-glucosylmutase
VSKPPLVATYRLQLTPTFGLDDATAVIPYLAELGISHVYTSSYLQSAAGSTHGYDTVDHSQVNSELGGEAALARFHEALRAHGLGNVIDVVPNHASVAESAANPRWWSVLRDGCASPHAPFFDIDWDPPEHKLAGRVLVPVLADDYWTELGSGAIELVTADGEAEIRYGELRLPVAAETVLPQAEDVRLGRDELHAVLEQQHYRLACWRVARDELNYRRFFDVTTLAGVRVEDDDVFAAVHERTLEWVARGEVQGLRVDHPDGLRDPTAYLTALRAAAPDAWIVVEKILEPGESLPDAWPVEGTTGYDVMRRITGVFVDPAAEPCLTATFAAFTGVTEAYPEMVRSAKLQAVRELLGTEVTRLTELAVRCCETGLVARDFSRRQIRTFLEALLASMPVYRTYVSNRPLGPSRADRGVIDLTVAAAAEMVPAIGPPLVEFMRRVLLGECTGDPYDEFVARFEQLSGPAMAKGVEDTVFYRYTPLLALNEVGSDPSHFGVSIDEFHRESIATADRSPRTMAATSTHDTKRSEDVRARIALLSEMPEEWHEIVFRWRQMNEEKWAGATPNRSTEHLLYQTLVGAHPLTRDRIHDVLVKSMREAKEVTSWLAPTPAEADMLSFADAIGDDPAFQSELDALVRQLDPAARIASLNQVILKVMGPGVPDFYQGSELIIRTLVDPDNRTAVDFDERRRLLDRLVGGPAAVDDPSLAKLDLTRRLLQLRRAVPDAFLGVDATYAPIAVRGDAARSAVAFSRGSEVVVAVSVRPLHFSRAGWGSSSIDLSPGSWRNALPERGPALSGTVDLSSIDDAETPGGHVVLVREGSR